MSPISRTSILAAAILSAAAAGAATSTAPPPIIPPRPTRAAARPARPAAPTKAHRLDLNTASAKELEALPAVGPSEARRIVDARPFISVADLSRAGLPKATLEKITPLVAVTGAGGVSTPMGAADEPMSPALPPKAGAWTRPPRPGMVWVDPATRTYRGAKDPASGRTPNGEWMTESRAIRDGYKKAS